MLNSDINSFDELAKKLNEAIHLIGISQKLNQHQIDSLIQYIKILQKWNKVYNLTAITKENDILVKHIIDCLAVLPNIYTKISIQNNCEQNHIKILDVGSGAGLPCIIWAIINPNWLVYSVDAVQKKIAFQNQVKLELKIDNLFPQHIRIQDFKLEPQKKLDIITARAYADTADIVNQTQHLLCNKGFYALLKGKDNEEFSLNKNSYNIEKINIKPPFLNAERRLVIININESIKN